MAEEQSPPDRLNAIRNTFPNARGVEITSAPSREYNCIAWAMGDTARVWWPFSRGTSGEAYWPPGVMRELSRRSFRWAFDARGFRPCDDGSLVPGIEKVALYEKDSKPTHAARQLPNGRWTSKLGEAEDVEHDLSDLKGRTYGQVAAYFERARIEPSAEPAAAPSSGQDAST